VCAEDAEVRAGSFEIAMMVELANNCSSTSLAEGDPAMPDPSLRRSEFFGCGRLASVPLSVALDLRIASNTLPISHLLGETLTFLLQTLTSVQNADVCSKR